MFSGALFIKLSLDLDLYAAIGILLFISALFTIGGNIRVYYNDELKNSNLIFFLIGGASAVIWYVDYF